MNLHELVQCVYQCPVNHSRSSQDETCNLTKLRPTPLSLFPSDPPSLSLPLSLATEISTPLNHIRCLFSAQSSKTHVKHGRCLIQIGSSYVKGAMAARQ